MSDSSDDMECGAALYEGVLDRATGILEHPNPVWGSKDGPIALSEIKDDHLKNILSFISKKGCSPIAKAWRFKVEEEISRRVNLRQGRSGGD